jgi:hypothetical protein
VNSIFSLFASQQEYIANKPSSNRIKQRVSKQNNSEYTELAVLQLTNISQDIKTQKQNG